MPHPHPNHDPARRSRERWVGGRAAAAWRNTLTLAVAFLALGSTALTGPALEPGFPLSIDRTPAPSVTIRYPSAPGQSFVLLQGFEPTRIATPISTNTGGSGEGRFVVTANALGVSFFRIERRTAPPANQPPVVTLVKPLPGTTLVAPADLTLEALGTDPEGTPVTVQFFAGDQPIGVPGTSPASAQWRGVPAGDYVLRAVGQDEAGGTGTSVATPIRVLDPQTAPLTRVTSSPGPGDSGVAVTRETVLHLSAPLSETNPLPNDALFATAGGRRLLTRLALSADRRSISLFYLENLPAGSRVDVVFDGSLATDFLGRTIDADGDGQPGGLYLASFDTVSITPIAQTAVLGRIFRSDLAPGELNATNVIERPLQGVIVEVIGAEESLRTTTLVDGSFVLSPSPAGRFFVRIDGRPCTSFITENPDRTWTDRAYYPVLEKAWEAEAGRTNNLAAGTGVIYLPLVAAESLKPVSTTEDTVVTFPASITNANPAFSGVQLVVPANSLVSANGTRGGRVGLAPVAADRLPEPLPPGLTHLLDISIQTDGPGNFDRPVPVRFPNLPDPATGQKLPPGAKSALWSFNHDLGEWVISGSMTVTADGEYLESDPGTGVTQPGWHGTMPGTSGTGAYARAVAIVPDANVGESRPLDCDCTFGGDYQVPIGLRFVEARNGDRSPLLGTYRLETQASNNGDSVTVTIRRTSGGGIASGPHTLPLTGPARFAFTLDDQPTVLAVYRGPNSTGRSRELVALLPPAPSTAAKPLYLAEFDEGTPLDAIGFSPNNHYLVAAGARDGNRHLQVFEVQRRRELTGWSANFLPNSPLQIVGFSPADVHDRHFTVLQQGPAASDTTLHLLRLNTLWARAVTERLADAGPNRRLDLQYSPCGDMLAVIRRVPGNDSVRLYRTRDGFSPQLSVCANRNIVRLVASQDHLLYDDGPYRDIPCRLLSTAALGACNTEPIFALPSTSTPFPLSGPLHFVVEHATTGELLRRGSRPANSPVLPNFITAPSIPVRTILFHPASRSLGVGEFVTGANGSSYVIPAILLAPDSAATDEDADGLSDGAEWVIGTNPRAADSDADGIPDGTEIDQGTNPLDNLPAATGIIASADTPGIAVDVTAINERAFLADGEAGVAILDVSNSQSPLRIAQVDTPGTARAVASAGGALAVADGAAGVAIIEATSNRDFRLTRQISAGGLGGGEVLAVAASADLAFAGTTLGQVAVIELTTGDVLQRKDLGGKIEDLAIEGTTLYAWANGKLFVIPFASGLLDLRGSVPIPGSVNAAQGRGRLFVGDDRAYAVHTRGVHVLEVANPDAPVLIQANDSVQQGWKHFAPNGSGRALAVLGLNAALSNDDDLSLYDATTPVIGDAQFITRFATPGIARAVALYNGLAYVADHANGLQVVNYLPYDNLGQPPQVELLLSETNEVTAGGLVILRARVRDDVQVRQVRFLLDGDTLVLDGTFPFEHVYRVPTNRVGQSLVFAAVATDTGGNQSRATQSIANVTADTAPPAVTIDSPTQATSFNLFDNVLVRVSAADASGIAELWVELNGARVASQRLSFGEFLFDVPRLIGGHFLQAVAIDNVGLRATSARLPFAVYAEAISREFGVYVGEPANLLGEGISREWSVYVAEADRLGQEAISRELSVFTWEPERFGTEGISREVTVEVK